MKTWTSKWRASVEEANALPLHIPQLTDHLSLFLSDWLKLFVSCCASVAGWVWLLGLDQLQPGLRVQSRVQLLYGLWVITGASLRIRSLTPWSQCHSHIAPSLLWLNEMLLFIFNIIGPCVDSYTFYLHFIYYHTGCIQILYCRNSESRCWEPG